MSDPFLTTNLTVAAATVTGLLIVRAQIDPSGTGLARQFRFALLVTALFYLVRAADWLTAFGLFRTLTIMAAATIPLAALILTEGLLRRHAPRRVKFFIAAGVAAFAGLSLILPLTYSFGFLYALLAFQLLSFAAVFWLLVTRDRASLSDTENITVDRCALTVPIIVLLLLSDYGFVALAELPYLSGLGALTAAWMTLTLEARFADIGRLLLSILAIAILSVLAAWLIGLEAGLSATDMLNAAAIAAALMLVLVIGLTAVAIRRDRTQASLVAALQETGSLDRFLNALELEGLMAGYSLLRQRDLADYDGSELVRVLGDSDGVGLSDLPKTPADDTLGESQVRELIARVGGREAMLVSETPLAVAVGTPTGIAASSGSELRSAFRLARVIAERDARREETP